MDEIQYQIIRNTETITTIKEHIIKLLEINDNDYNNKEKNIESIIRQCYIRAFLTIIHEDIAYDINEYFHKLIESDEYLRTHQNNEISENIIIKCFKSQKYDRKKIRSISIKLPR